MKKYSFQRSPKGSTLGIGLAAAAAGAAITYFLYETEKGQQSREKISEMAGKMKERAMYAKERMSDVTSQIADAGTEMYENISGYLKEKKSILKSLDKEDSDLISERIRSHWDELRDEIEEILEKSKENKEE